MAIHSRSFDEMFEFTRPVPADYLGSDGQPVRAAPDVPRFDHTLAGHAQGLQISAPLDEVAGLPLGAWYRQDAGTWIVAGRFAGASLIDGVTGPLYGDGTVVISYDATTARVYADGGLLAEVSATPASTGTVTLSASGDASVRRVEYRPSTMGAEQAAELAIGRVSSDRHQALAAMNTLTLIIGD